MINRNVQTVAAVVAAVAVLGFFARKQVGGAVDAIANINDGTDFEGSGPVGTLANATDAVLFGVPSAVGSAIGEFFSGSFFDRRTLDDLTGT